MAARPGETEDLASLTHLNEAILLDELKARYKKDDIYVSIDNTRIPWIGNAHKNLLTFLVTVRQFVSVLFAYTPAAILVLVLDCWLSNCVGKSFSD